jgi:hypothetical protein
LNHFKYLPSHVPNQNAIGSKNVIAEAWLEPIRNPVTGKAHRAIIEIPEGFESTRMNQASMRTLVANDDYLSFRYEGTYVVYQKTLGKDHKSRYCTNFMSVVQQKLSPYHIPFSFPKAEYLHEITDR